MELYNTVTEKNGDSAPDESRAYIIRKDEEILYRAINIDQTPVQSVYYHK